MHSPMQSNPRQTEYTYVISQEARVKNKKAQMRKLQKGKHKEILNRK